MSRFRFLNFELSEAEFSLTRDHRRVALEPKILKVLLVLAARAGRLVEKQELLDSVWPGVFVEDNTLTRAVGVLRRELGDNSREPRVIETIPTRGYRFIAPVETLGEIAGKSEEKQKENTSASEPFNASAKPRWRWWMFVAAAACVAALLAFAIHRRRLARYGPIHSLAVLPLDDLSPERKEDYFADGLTDELIAELAQIQSLRVVSRRSVMREKGKNERVGEIARELGVEAVVEGSVVRSGDRVRVTAQLIDARTDRHLWAQTFEEPLGDILSLQDNIAREIATRTRAVLTPADRVRLSSAHTIRPPAHDDYLRGLYFIDRREGERAAGYFRAALALEPGYAPAWSGLAQAIATEAATNHVRAPDAMPSALEAAKRAVQLDPENGNAYLGLGYIESFLRDWAASERDLRHGISLSPGNALGHTYLLFYLVAMNHPGEAVTEARRALELDPLGFWTNRNLGVALYYDRRYDEALAALRRATEIAPDRPAFVDGWISDIAEAQGHDADAAHAEMLGIASAVSPHEFGDLRSAFAAGGWKEYQQTRIRFLLSRSSTPCTSDDLAMSYLRIGRIPEAFRWFQREADEYCVSVSSLAADPRLDLFRQKPQYIALQDRLNLPH